MSERTCRFVTLGCKVNQYETQLVKEALERAGYREAVDDEQAELCLVNTCTVTGEADSKARQVVRQLSKHNPGCQTIVFGCYAAREPEALSKLPGVLAVVSDNRELPDVLDRFGVTEFPTAISRFDGHRRAFVKVQDGCLLNCTYCIIPSVRPGIRSRDPDAIEAEIRGLIDNGYREIILTGIHLGHFGVEATRGRTGKERFRLAHLVRRLNAIPGRWRLRLSSLEAAELGPEFIDAVADCERLCPHFHLCLQSGSDTVLARMKRRYRTEGFLRNVELLRKRFDRVALSTDIIVGFPGETDQEFAQTLSACEAAGFMKIHHFSFSPRRGTPAATFPDQVRPEVKRQRCEEIVDLENRLTRRYHNELMSQQLSVLVEAKPASRAGWVRGTACRYVSVELPGARSDVGDLIDVTVEGSVGDALRGSRGSVTCVDDERF